MTAPGLRPLYPHQTHALDLLRASLMAGCSRPVLQLPTGGGKTVIAAAIVTGARGKNKRVAFCVPSLGLIDQTFERFVENGIDPADMGVLQGDHPWRRPHAPIQICTAQTLTRRSLPDVDVVVIDECHVRFDVYERWMREKPHVVFIGLSATPWSKGLGKLYDFLAKPTSIRELIDAGFLSPFRVFAPSHPDLAGVKTVAGDYHEGQLGERMNKAELVADIVGTWLARGENRPTLCFATGRAHAQALHERFGEAGVAAAYVDANTPREEREQIGKALGAGDVKVVVNIGCLTQGIDWDVRCIILARPTKSHILFVQIIGRGLRIAPDKLDCLILDHSDTHLRLGMVTDIDFDELDDGTPRAKAEAREKSDKTPLPKECAACAGLIPAGVRQCPCCGHEPKPAVVREAEGELFELTGERPKRKRDPVKDRLAALGKQEIFSQLEGIRQQRGRSTGWKAHAYREIFGTWPRGLADGLAAEPSYELWQWVRSRDIAYARAKQREAA